MLRRQLKSLVLKGMGMEAEVQTHNVDAGPTNNASRGGVNIKDLEQTGSRNELNIGRDGVNVERTKQEGTGQKINVYSDRPEQK
jgi:hypothetical protein